MHNICRLAGNKIIRNICELYIERAKTSRPSWVLLFCRVKKIWSILLLVVDVSDFCIILFFSCFLALVFQGEAQRVLHRTWKRIKQDKQRQRANGFSPRTDFEGIHLWSKKEFSILLTLQVATEKFSCSFFFFSFFSK